MHRQIEVIFENGILRPLDRLPDDLREHQRYTITIDGPLSREDRLDRAYLAAAEQDADPTVGVEEARRILARVPDTLAEAVRAERAER